METGPTVGVSSGSSSAPRLPHSSLGDAEPGQQKCDQTYVDHGLRAVCIEDAVQAGGNQVPLRCRTQARLQELKGVQPESWDRAKATLVVEVEKLRKAYAEAKAVPVTETSQPAR